jgi:hypothetical protein
MPVIKDWQEPPSKEDNALLIENQALRLHIKKIESELAHVQMLLNRLDLSNIVRPLSDEEEIASIQLEKIKMMSRERQLTLEEAKLYDIYVKNKKLAQGEATQINGKSLAKKPKSDLLKIAATKK